MKTYKNLSRYEIHEDGTVFDLKRQVPVGVHKSSDGYSKVTLTCDDGKRRTFSVHRLVALCYVDNPDNLPEVNHEDGVKENCHYSNLKWMTHAQNIQHAWDTGLLKSTPGRSEKLRKAFTGKKTGKDNIKSRPVLCITTNETFDSITAAINKYGGAQAHMSRCCSNAYGAKSCGRHPDTNEKLVWRYL